MTASRTLVTLPLLPEGYGRTVSEAEYSVPSLWSSKSPQVISPHDESGSATSSTKASIAPSASNFMPFKSGSEGRPTFLGNECLRLHGVAPSTATKPDYSHKLMEQIHRRRNLKKRL